MNVHWDDGTSLYHYGIPGQKRGVRRYQNPDGSLTEEGKRRYGYTGNVRNPSQKEYAKDRRSRIKSESEAIRNSKRSNREKAKALSALGDHENSAEYYKQNARNLSKAKTLGNVAYVGAAALATKAMSDRINNGKMTAEQAIKIGKHAAVGKALVDTMLTAMQYDAWDKYRKEYWKPNG